MDKFYLGIAGVLITAILILTLRKHNGEIAILLSICGCCLVISIAASFLRPVIDFIERLQQIGSLNQGMLGILLKVTAVACTSEIAATVCADAGNGALGKALQILSTAVILYLSLPMMTALLDLVEGILWVL